MVEDWQSIIKQLEAKQKTFLPGDPEILNVSSIIQSIQGEALGGNFGHARFSLAHPEVKEETLADIRLLIARYLPREDNNDPQ